MDDQAFAEAGIFSQSTAMRWLEKQQPKCAQAIAGARFLDFVVLPDYSYDCKQLMGENNWAITGEAGLFTDPFYSPGSDFIAISNCCITELVAGEVRGDEIRSQRMLYERTIKAIYANTLSLYMGTYGGFGDRKMMALKLVWDYSYYWGILSLLFFNDALANRTLMREVVPVLQEAQVLNAGVQQLFCRRARQRLVLENRGVFLDQYRIPCLHHFNQQLMRADGNTIMQDLRGNVEKLRTIAFAVEDMLSEKPAAVASEDERALLGDYRSLVV